MSHTVYASLSAENNCSILGIICNMSKVDEVNLDEQKFRIISRLNELWWNENGDLVTLHSSSKLLARYIRDEIVRGGIARADSMHTDTPLSDVSVLEVGCGGGILTEQLARMGCTITGIDVIVDLIEVGKQRASSDPFLLSKVIYKKESVEEHAVHNAEKYDVVVSHFCLEQSDDHNSFINFCSKCLKPGGIIFTSTVSKTFWSWLGIVYLFEKFLKCIPVGMHDWDRCITAGDFRQILKRNDCTTIGTRGFYYNYFTKNSFWIPGLCLFYITHAKKNIHEEQHEDDHNCKN
ncbi:hypothetical protein RI129_008396 [Pyrocoelia pectoralis]|uniref:Methyltransferase type 11 domain-containing protein n=1 Tax=Pyrocoelia pectoralis TaxID=417401 RepID=A0AAN7VF64_9COLE